MYKIFLEQSNILESLTLLYKLTDAFNEMYNTVEKKDIWCTECLQLVDKIKDMYTKIKEMDINKCSNITKQ